MRTPVPCGPRRTRTRSSVRRPSVVDRGVGLGDDVLLLLVGGQVADLVGDLAVDDGAVRRLDEAVLVDPGVGGQGADQADVRAFGRLDRAHAAVVRRVDVSDLEAGALTGETTWPERGQAALVGQARQRVVLVHELAELRGAEELLHRGHHRADVDQRLRRDGLDVLGGHALAHDPLHAATGRPAPGSGSARRPSGCGGWRSGPGRRCGRSTRRRPCAGRGGACRWPRPGSPRG